MSGNKPHFGQMSRKGHVRSCHVRSGKIGNEIISHTDADRDALSHF